MAITVATVISEVQAVFPEATSAEIVTHVNTVDRDLGAQIKLRREMVDVSLTASDDEYVISETIIRVWAAHYVESSTRSNQYPLQEISRDELNNFKSNFRLSPDNKPRFYYLDVDSAGDIVVGLYPIPPTTTSGGYPKVVLETTKWATLNSGSSLPAKIKNIRAYKAGVCFYYAQATRKREAQYWEQEYEKAKAEEIKLENGRLAQLAPKMKPSWVNFGRFQ